MYQQQPQDTTLHPLIPTSVQVITPPTSAESSETMATAGCGGGGCREVGRFAMHVIRGRWITLFSSFLVMIGAGGTYLFGLYSNEIKSTLGYDQSTLNLLGFFKDLGANIGVFSGLIAEFIPIWFLLLIGAVMNFTGYFMIWMSVTGRIATPKVWQMCMYICIGANSQNFANTGALVTSVVNFPENRGIMVGLLKGFAGLSAAIITQIYLAVYGDDSRSLILLIGWLPAAISFVAAYTIRAMKVVRQPNELRVLYRFLYLAIVIALFLMVITIIQNVVGFTRPAYGGSATVVCALIFGVLLIAIRAELPLWNQKKQLMTNPNKIAIEKPRVDSNPTLSRLSSTELEAKPVTSCCASLVNKPERGEDYSILQGILSMDMFFLFVATGCGIGSSLTAVDNLGQIGESLGYPTKTIHTFVSLVSIWSFFGRIFAGIVSENLLIKYKFPRPLMTALVMLFSCIGLLLIAFPVPGSVYVASVIIGFSFGAQFPLMNAIISELFGLKHYSTLFNFGQLASPMGSYILNVVVTGPLYDREARKQLARTGTHRLSDKALTCLGVHCYRLSFIILTAATFFGALSVLILVARTRDFYKGDIYKKFREAAEPVEAAEEEMDLSSDGSEIRSVRTHP